MRIFYAICYRRVGGSWVDKNFYPALIDMGHEVIRYDWDPPFHPTQSRRWHRKDKPEMNKILVEKVREANEKEGIDLFFSYFNDRLVYPETIEKIRDMGIPTLNFYFDDTHDFHAVENISPAFDYCWTTSRDAVPKYKEVGAKPIYAPPAAHPSFYKPYPLKRDFDVTFVGQGFGERPGIVRKIKEAGIDIRVWGHGWLRGKPIKDIIRSNFSFSHIKSNNYNIAKSIDQSIRDFYGYYVGWGGIKGREIKDLRDIAGPPLPFEELVKMYSRSRISLGFGGHGPLSEWTKRGRRLAAVKLRDFEAPMSRAFYLTGYIKDLEEFYNIGKEIVCYQDTDDLIDKIKYYLAHEDEAEEVREAGYQRARRDHTWTKRFEKIFKEMGIN